MEEEAETAHGTTEEGAVAERPAEEEAPTQQPRPRGESKWSKSEGRLPWIGDF